MTIKVTVLKSNDRRANKKFILNDDGKVESVNRGFPYKFDSSVEEFKDILDVSERLPNIFRDPYKMAVQGLPIEEPQDKTRKGYNFQNNETRWICLDVDDMPNVSTHDQALTRFPRCLQDVSYLFRYSSSSGVKNSDGSYYKPEFRGHFIFVLESPTPLGEIRSWARTIPSVDTALFSKVQPHFFAEPEFGEKVDCDIEQRWIFIKKDRDEVSDLVVESIDDQENPSNQNHNMEVMIRECSFLTWCRLSPRIPEPEWYAMLSLIDLETAHELSSDDSRYDPEETRRKWDQAQTKSEPRTCRNISEMHDGCRSCKYLGRAHSPTKIPAMGDLSRDYVQVIGTEQFFELNRKISYSRTQFDSLKSLEYENRGRNRASVIFEASPDGRKVDTMTYRPGSSMFMDEDGLSSVNIWKPSKVEPIEGSVEPWMAHLDYMIGEDAYIKGVVLDWMAFQVQHPGKKVNWALFMGGGQGIGKGLLFEPLLEILGRENCRTITPDDLSGGWTHWLKGTKLVLVEEMASFGKREIANRLKPLITDPPKQLQINEKNIKQFYVPNLTAWIFMSNESDALIIDNDDRRFFVVWSDSNPKSERYYAELAAWNRQPGKLMKFLLDRDISSFNPGGRAPSTKAKESMAFASTSPLSQYIRECVEEGHGIFTEDLVYSKDVFDHIANETNFGRNLSQQKMGKALKDAGCEPYGTRINVSIDGKVHKRLIYITRNLNQYLVLSPTKMKNIMMKRYEKSKF